MEWVSGNVFIRPMHLRAVGEKIIGHTHNFDHTSIVFKGVVRIKAVLPDGRLVEREFGEGRATRHALIKAGVSHEIEALTEDAEVWCVYSHRIPQGLEANRGLSPEYDALLDQLVAMTDGTSDVVQEFTGWDEAYH